MQSAAPLTVFAIRSRPAARAPRAAAAPALALALLCGVLSACATPPAPTMPDPAISVRKAQEIATEAEDLERRGDIDGAIIRYRDAIAVYSDFFLAWNNLGRLQLEKNNALDAANSFKTASELAPKDPRPLKNLGDVWAKQSYFEEASRYYNAALERDPNFLPALRESVRMDHLRDNRNEATAARIQRALLQETDPKWREFLLRQKQLAERFIKK